MHDDILPKHWIISAFSIGLDTLALRHRSDGTCLVQVSHSEEEEDLGESYLRHADQRWTALLWSLVYGEFGPGNHDYRRSGLYFSVLVECFHAYRTKSSV